MPFHAKVSVRRAQLAVVSLCLGLFISLDLVDPRPSYAQGCLGCVPLDDPSGPAHHGYPLGLYPGGSNSPPPTHAAMAMDAASRVIPRDASGSPSGDGLIGFIMGDLSAARACFDEGIVALREVGFRVGLAKLLGEHGVLALELHDFETARDAVAELAQIVGAPGFGPDSEPGRSLATLRAAISDKLPNEPG